MKEKATRLEQDVALNHANQLIGELEKRLDISQRHASLLSLGLEKSSCSRRFSLPKNDSRKLSCVSDLMQSTKAVLR